MQCKNHASFTLKKSQSDMLTEPSPVSPPSRKLLEQLSAYQAWTLEVWSSTGGQAPSNGIEDLIVMACGLPGETGEMLEQNAYMGTCKEDRRELVVEFGDVLYNWARIIRHFEIDVKDVLEVSDDESFLPAGAARMPISCGLVCEAIKKFVRNDNLVMTNRRHASLVHGLGLMWQDISQLLTLRSIGLDHVIDVNQSKLRHRIAKKLTSQANCQAEETAVYEARLQSMGK